MSTETSMRRVPRQQRSQKRVEVILRAAAELVTEMGYEAMTTSAIAERAGTSIGSLYQFFPNKDSVLYALAQRYTEEMRSMTSRVFSPDVEYVPTPVLIDRTVNALVDFEYTHPGFNLIFNSAWISQELKFASDGITDAMIEDFDRVIALKSPTLADEHRRVCAETMMGMIKGLLPLTLTDDLPYRGQVIHEFKRALQAYLTALIPLDGPA
ncbi:MAG: TetR/AcrR family transcriptional regulator [bacterium]|nr:TetR/AcrR family transcriptional regulator [bacterium]